MKSFFKAVAVMMLLVSTGAFAANFDGSYTFSSRSKEGKPDMQNWNGTMTIKGDEMYRTYKSADGKEQKFYTSIIKQDGKIYILKHTKAYKPEYIGNEHRSKIILSGATLILESEDGKFKENWDKK
ncbi:MAG: hypothetical protein Q7T03_10400 [Deltaproteobacteria bacterium]|nr:hypothetical protein [Deltaproteobacteria bacterium]